ncbi:ATP-dependent DNA helicase PcrA [candidate division WWE3 bacterium CG_4_9_14_0_2_um_filter_35_11]|uniref:DNA 3'-5' helicase n=1 Tax=candidate division WWE3 bacterium CG_4_9_14_0_2_um_filter_35_11 TaxID=1975077 RepID=A0A2M8ELJ6_UNCKA|nr:MAG: ATP-dependent DNA helicase PcrA [candidate division WWE3 bacterium CG10_big_fil_rev_8_21_14_0_10_35_32]PJC23616.1 MAG: ATP-dependent DNA helicase PcrA [candidate division WWE3 bacterium CG_4_9_14_0_2_um_filter_35_11]
MDLLSELNQEQKDVVLHDSGPAMIIAGPGSGKTRALTHKIAYLMKDKGLSSDQILAVTFTNKAAKEMKERVESLLKDTGFIAPSWIGTFHSICVRILRIEGQALEIARDFVIYDTDDSIKIIKEVMADIGDSMNDLAPKAVLSSISRAKSELIDPKEYARQSGGNYFFDRVSKIYPKYQERLKDNHALDFDDIIFAVVKLFHDNPNVLEKYQNKFLHVLVDEYQDTNRVQYSLVKMIAKKRKNLTVVGDVSQSIYSWRGADYRNMLQFEKDYPGSKVYKLEKNYRSTKNILSAAKTLIENNSTHISIDLYTDNVQGEKVFLYEAEHEKSEASYVADMISMSLVTTSSHGPEYLEKTLFSDCAVLYRTNAQSRAIEEAFITSGIPYRIVGGVKFYDRREIRDVLAYLRVFQNPRDTISWDRCINTPTRGIGKKAMERIREGGYNVDLIEELTGLNWRAAPANAGAALIGATPLTLLDAVLKDFGYLEYLNDGTEESVSRIENIKELRTVAAQFSSLQEFLENVALVEASNRAADTVSDAVTLMTLHSAKGLEFDHVFMVGMEEGIFPHSRAMTDPKELEEERRLCYVGITRAKKSLFLTYTRRRTLFGQSGVSIVSRFIAELPEEVLKFSFS